MKDRFPLGSIAFFLLFTGFGSGFSQTSSIADFREMPHIRWEFRINEPFYSSPVVKDGLVFCGGLDSLLHVVDLTTGKEKWNFRTGGEIRSNVCFGKDCLYLNGGAGILYCLNLSGKILWKFASKGERKYDFADYFQSTPVLTNNVVYFGSGDGTFYAVNAGNGSLLWSFETSGIIHNTAAISSDKIFFGSFDGYVYALSLAEGKLIWKFKTVGHMYFPKGEVEGSPSVSGNLLFIGARDYNVYCIDQEKGYCHWNKAFTRGWGLNPCIHDSVLYIGMADERKLIAADPSTGAEFWKTNMEFLVFGNNAYSDSMLYVGTTMGKLHGKNLKTGAEVWSFATDTYQKARFKYFKQDDSYRDDIYDIIKSNEQFLDVEVEMGGVFSTPWISANQLIFSSTNGTIYCLER
jgi:outer membrane protein assembly factor BamB